MIRIFLPDFGSMLVVLSSRLVLRRKFSNVFFRRLSDAVMVEYGEVPRLVEMKGLVAPFLAYLFVYIVKDLTGF